MPKRQALRKVETPEIMGDDSYLIYKPITIEEQRNLLKQSKEYQNTINKHTKKYAKAIGKDISDLTNEDNSKMLLELENPDELMHFMDKVLSERIVEWNWVDDDDEPMLPPSEDWKIMLSLYSHEYDFIHKLFAPDDNTEKK